MSNDSTFDVGDLVSGIMLGTEQSLFPQAVYIIMRDTDNKPAKKRSRYLYTCGKTPSVAGMGENRLKESKTRNTEKE